LGTEGKLECPNCGKVQRLRVGKLEPKELSESEAKKLPDYTEKLINLKIKQREEEASEALSRLREVKKSVRALSSIKYKSPMNRRK
jgi:uncharacterized Zn finger protein (UPF0148 family)